MPRAQRNDGNRATVADFHASLILAQWALSFFGEGSFAGLRAVLSREALEGVNAETGQTFFFEELTSRRLFDMNRVPAEKFAEYDRNVVAHWNAITARRETMNGSAPRMKYFQWLSLLAAELYLDRFFNDKAALLRELNDRVAEYDGRVPAAARLGEVKEADLNKVSFWEATGAGKTLLMHVNLRQYLHYARAARRKPAKVIVLTPNEGLTRQHLAEFELSGFSAAELREEDLASAVASVHVIDAGKLISDASSRRQGEKSLMAEAFEGDNLVLVDEGHNGSTREDGERRRAREQICRDGFSFEYSATFGQAVAGRDKKELRKIYAKNILFDYSYKHFYEDGYGKDWEILNMPDDGNADQLSAYLGASLLAFYLQRRVFDGHAEVCARRGVEKPLCIFVGGSVNTENSDVEAVLRFFAKVLTERGWCEDLFGRLIDNAPVLTDRNGGNPFRDAFLPLKTAGETGAGAYAAMLKALFGTESSARLKVMHLARSGEILLYAGTARAPFGLVNIGDGGKFVGALREEIAKNPEAFPADVVPEDAFTPAQFERINRADSPISFLIGSKKFTEGWSSWRVSTMGLLNVGVNEGTQIIQLFGRGVRLRGENFSLKRSTEAERRRENADFLRQVETLRIFGVRSAYMEKFKEYLSEEGISPEKDVLQVCFSPMRNMPDGVKLKTLCVADGYRLTQENGFRARERAVLCEISEEDARTLKLPVAEYNDFSFVQSFSSDGRGAESGTRAIPEAKLDRRAFPFFDWDGIYRELMTYKARCGYWNLRLEKEKIVNFCSTRDGWYRLYTRADDVKFDSFEKLPKLEELFKKLLFDYADKFYKAFQARYESEHMTTRELSGNEIPEEYAFEIENSETGLQWKTRLEQLKAMVENRSVPAEFNRWSSDDFVAIAFPRHLYSPLLYARDGKVLPFRMKPLSFDAPSEFRFVRDLQTFYEDPANAGYFRGVDMYLMRNAAKSSKGIGFAQAGNFYPDFLLWLVDKESGKQFLTFVDPKGIRNLKRNDPKLNFYEEIKTLQRTVREEAGTDGLTLNCIVLSATKFEDVLFDGTQEELEAANILFLDDGGASYLPKLLAKARKE